MHLYDITKNHHAYTCKTKLSTEKSLTRSLVFSIFRHKVARVSASPDTSLKRKIDGTNFQRHKGVQENNEALNAIYSQRPQGDISCRLENEKENIIEYIESCKHAFFNHPELPKNSTIDRIKDLQELVFPLIVVSNNKIIPNVIHYFTDARDVAKHIVEGPSGQQQFVYYNEGHAICVDAFKDKEDNISIITIDCRKVEGDDAPDTALASEIFGNWDIKEGKLSMLNLQTDLQRNYTGCKYFSLAFAEQTAIDPNIISQHQLNINGAKSKKRNVRHLLNLQSSEKLLGSYYYQHAHSSKRINKLSKEIREGIVSPAGSLLETHEKYRVEKITGKKETITFSNSIDFFRKKLHENIMEQLNKEICENK
ncbi:YopJ family acetyltransferase [Erwinia pyrifoliae]|uniref:Short-chain dehydrogenase n=1 Tax=Erwinia pyrifoliae TaxID=79967 RepID=A0ABY5X3R4_ERWPY|nr:YopJ family acetyltransferase [Erwinia pyrifoliae]AUX72403.1 short-chain dehydrogenase [Erwinia pyrifoliae]MCA8877347.1 short-chain dehydrogenase [Erwinia pyrifoliae]MCT2388709.1 short-chain dehydrogenase [Erwinia pyrifoliae]MCU8586878.1 short-chain dehydrogenase [Erwinia pyrifoliae]UWS30749.1 short-chain dehydrogenase [Erwinia pyrifoliae]